MLADLRIARSLFRDYAALLCNGCAADDIFAVIVKVTVFFDQALFVLGE